MADLLVLPRPAKSLQNGAGFNEKRERNGPAEKERVASMPEKAVGKYARAVFAKRERNRAVSPEH